MSDLIQLSAIEARVLGTLMEKQLTTPDQYPLTANGLVTGCNQKTSREPASKYSSGEVTNCLNGLRDRKLVEVEYGSRADRYLQQLSRTLYLDQGEQALLTIMLLRGPQTSGDLLNRAQRMKSFDSAAAIEELLNTLCLKTSPIIVRVLRKVGQRDDRYMHLLCGTPDDLAAVVTPTNVTATNSVVEESAVTGGEKYASKNLTSRVLELEEQLEKVLEHLGLSEKPMD